MHHKRPQSFLFADLVGFAALAERHGDETAADVATLLAAVAAQLAEDHDARLVKSLGDAVMIHSPCPVQAVRLGLRLHTALAAVPGFPPVHAGVHTGVAVERAGDWFGATVNLAARVAEAARGGELLVTAATLAAAGRLDGVKLDDRGPRRFKNIPTPTPVYSARAVDGEAAATATPTPTLGWVAIPALAGQPLASTAG